MVFILFLLLRLLFFFFFFQAEDGIRDFHVTGVQTCALPISPDGGSLLVRGRYPRTPSRCVRPERSSLLARYPGTLSVKRSDGGTLSLTVTLPFERYLQGIAEVPPSWPTAALEAQAIAARSYALATTGWSGSQGETLKTPICASTSCQVYGGIPVPPEADIRRWYRAVRATSGEVLLRSEEHTSELQSREN